MPQCDFQELLSEFVSVCLFVSLFFKIDGFLVEKYTHEFMEILLRYGDHLGNIHSEGTRSPPVAFFGEKFLHFFVLIAHSTSAFSV